MTGGSSDVRSALGRSGRASKHAMKWLGKLWRKLTYREGTWYITKNGRVYYNWERWNPPSIKPEEWFSEPSDS